MRSAPSHEEPGEWAAAGGLLLVAILVASLMAAWNNPRTTAYYDYRQGTSLLRQGRYTYAVSALERALPFMPHPHVRLELARAYLARHDTVRAERQVRLVLESGRRDLRASALLLLGKTLALDGRHEEALAAWEEAEAAARDDLIANSAAWHRGMTHWRRGAWEAAQRELSSLLDSHPSHQHDPYTRGASVKLAQLLGPNDPGAAVHLLEDLQAREDPGTSPGSATPQLAIPDLGLAAFPEGMSADTASSLAENLGRALHETDRLRAAGASPAQLLTLWGSVYLQQEENLLARHVLEEALQRDPANADAQAHLGLTLMNLGEHTAASGHLLRAAGIAPRSPLVRHALLQFNIARHEWDQAEHQFRMLEEIEPAGVERHLQRAEFYRLQGLYDEAEDALLDAVSAQRKRPAGAAGGNAYLALARFYTDVRGLGCEGGLPAAQEALLAAPSDPAAVDAIGWALLICGQPEEALVHLERAVSLAPTVPRYNFHLARAYVDLGRTEDARDRFFMVSDLDPGGDWEHAALSEIVRLPQAR